MELERCYEILGVKEGTPWSVIHDNYQKLIRIFGGQSSNKMQEISKAYFLLRDYYDNKKSLEDTKEFVKEAVDPTKLFHEYLCYSLYYYEPYNHNINNIANSLADGYMTGVPRYITGNMGFREKFVKYLPASKITEITGGNVKGYVKYYLTHILFEEICKSTYATFGDKGFKNVLQEAYAKKDYSKLINDDKNSLGIFAINVPSERLESILMAYVPEDKTIKFSKLGTIASDYILQHLGYKTVEEQLGSR